MYLWNRFQKGNGGSCVLSAYSSSVINLSNHLTTSLGITAQYFTLNKNWTVEPRAALKWSFNPKTRLGTGIRSAQSQGKA